MKRFLIIISALFILAGSDCFAKVWRVDKSPENKPDFVSLQEAVNTIPAGDTLYVYGHSVSYGDIVLSKKVIIIGPGYLLNQNPITQALKVSAKAYFTFESGSEFSQICGMEIGQMIVFVSNISIYKNYFNYNGYNEGCIVFRKANLSSIIISQNYFSVLLGFSPYHGPYVCITDAAGSLMNVIIKHNIFNVSSYQNLAMQLPYPESYFIIENNVFSSGIQLPNVETEFRNNIIVAGLVLSNYGFIAKNNVCSADQLPATDNKTNIDMTTVFVGGTSPDGYYQLKDNSPAKGYGWNGVDCGAFGGADAYVLSGIPSIPTIYEADIPITGSNIDGLPVKIKAKTNK
jgi:hypothetical protein